MNTNDQFDIYKEHGCLPHQTEFATKFFAPESARKHLLASPPGLGKGFVGAAIVSHALVSKPTSRILVMTPSALVPQWQATIRQADTDISMLVVDRRYFRELDAKRGEGESPWPTSGVVLLSIDFAKQEDVSDSLAGTVWDLIIIDEFQNITVSTRKHELVSSLLHNSPDARVLFLGTAGPWGASKSNMTCDPLFSGATVTMWSREDIKNEDGKPLLPAIEIEWITHCRKPDELAVLTLLQESLQAIMGPGSKKQLIATMLMQSASSSLFALEQRLSRIRQLRNEQVHGILSCDDSSPDVEDVSVADATDNDSECPLMLQPELNELAIRLLPMLENVESDSKFDVLQSLLEGQELRPSRDRRVCIFTRFVDTATYLESLLCERHSPVRKITGGSSNTERTKICIDFEHDGGILILTEAMATTLPEVVAVVFYDLPLNPARLDAQIGQFVRVGRRGPIRLFGFRDESNVLVIERLQRKLRQFKDAVDESEIQRLLFSKDSF